MKLKRGYDLEREGSYQYTYALPENSANLKDDRGQPFGSYSQSVAHVIVGAVDFPLVKDADKIDSYDNPGNDRADAPLQVGEVTTRRIDHSGHPDEGYATDFGCDDGTRNGQPGKGSSAEKEVLDVSLLASQEVSDPSGQEQVARYYAPINGGEILVKIHPDQTEICFWANGNAKGSFVNNIPKWEQVLVFLIVIIHKDNWMKVFTLLIGGAALFIAGCAAYFSVRGIALTFGAVSAFTIPIIIMASSLEFGKLIAASFLYRHWKTCNKTLRTYLSLAVVLLVGITSAGIYGYLSQAFEQTLSQVEGYEKQIASLTRQQGEYDRLISAYQSSGQKGSAMREEKQADERKRLESYITERRGDIKLAEASKATMAKETDEMIIGERGRRQAEQERLESVIGIRRQDIVALENQKKEYKKEVDLRIEQELAKETKANERLAKLDASVKFYRDKGRTFLEDGIKKANELLKNQAGERDALRATLSEINAASQKARDDLTVRYKSIDGRISLVQKEISEASLKITGLTTGGAEQADNVKTALETLQVARADVDARIRTLESEIAEASRKITDLSEKESVFGPDSSAELEAKKSELLAKKETAEREILALQGKIRATDIGSFKFVASAFDSEVAAAEATGNPILIKEAMDNAVNRVVKWFIMILVVVFDPLAVTLVIAYNASLLRKPEDETETQADSGASEEDDSPSGFFRLANLPIILVVGGLAAWGIFSAANPGGNQTAPRGNSELPGIGDAKTRLDDRAFAYVPEQAFGVCSFSGLRMIDEVDVTKSIIRPFLNRVPFLGELKWDPESCGINPEGRALYFLQFPTQDTVETPSFQLVGGLVLPIADASKLKEFILQELDLKSQAPSWKVVERQSPDYLSIQHKSAYVSLGLDENCLVMITSLTPQSDAVFLDKDLEQVFVSGRREDAVDSAFRAKLSGNDYDLALALNGANFFGEFKKTPAEEELFNQFREFLSFELILKAKARSGEVSLDGEYAYEKPVLNSDFGFTVARKLDAVRDGTDPSVLSGPFGGLVDLFLQTLDYQTAVKMLSRIDLESPETKGFEDFESLESGSKIRAESTGSFKMRIKSHQSGGDSLSLMIKLLYFATLGNGGGESSKASAFIQESKK